MYIINKNIKNIREYEDIKQREMAKILGVSRAAYSFWEINKTTIPLEYFNKFANHFNLSMDYIAGLSNIKEKNLNHNELDKIEIGKRLKQSRKESKLTQVQIAEKLNTTHSVLSAYENGKVLIQTIFIIEWAKLTNTSIDYLCCKTNIKKILN